MRQTHPAARPPASVVERNDGHLQPVAFGFNVWQGSGQFGECFGGPVGCAGGAQRLMAFAKALRITYKRFSDGLATLG